MHHALLEVHRRDTCPELIRVQNEEELKDRLDKLQASDSVLCIHIFRPTETLTRKVTFVSS